MRVVDADVVAGTDGGRGCAHAAAVTRLLAAFTAQDRAEIEALLDPDCIWRVPGDNALAGDYVGLRSVFELFGTLRRLFTGPAHFDVIDIALGRDRAIVFQYASVEVGGRPLRLKECLVFRFSGGRIVEAEEFQHDQAAFDAAFSRSAVARLLAG